MTKVVTIGILVLAVAAMAFAGVTAPKTGATPSGASNASAVRTVTVK